MGGRLSLILHRLSGWTLLCALVLAAPAQTIVFDFDSAPLHTSLPISLSSGGFTIQVAATGQGFSVQRADVMGFTPAGFSGACLYPNSVFPADLEFRFSAPVSSASILYAPQELGCDTSATLRLNAWIDGVPVGSTTTNAQSPGTWPSQTLSFVSATTFNRMVIHYDARPACSDYGPIFMADNLEVLPAVAPSLTIRRATIPDQVDLAWTTNAVGFHLEASGTVGGADAWVPVANPPVVSGAEYLVRLETANTAVFYRLRR